MTLSATVLASKVPRVRLVGYDAISSPTRTIYCCHYISTSLATHVTGATTARNGGGENNDPQQTMVLTVLPMIYTIVPTLLGVSYVVSYHPVGVLCVDSRYDNQF